MINCINKLVWMLANPMAIAVLALILASLCLCGNSGVLRRRIGIGLAVFSGAWLWLLGMPVTGWMLERHLEGKYPILRAEDSPGADAIVLLGGGIMGPCKGGNYPYPDMTSGADRVWHAVRLWRAGKAPVIIPSCIGADSGDVVLLRDFGVPDNAMLIENKAVNTEENAKFSAQILEDSRLQTSSSKLKTSKPKVLLVTSGWHMHRSLLMFKKYAPDLEAIPASTDCEASMGDGRLYWQNFIPTTYGFSRSDAMLHEIVGYYGYKWLRK